MVKFGVRSHTGLVREINEDSYNVIAGYSAVPVSFVIADGMGGHNSGEVASKIAVDFVSKYLMEFPGEFSDEENLSETLKKVISAANSKIYGEASGNKDYFGMGTTLIMAVVLNKKIFIGHVGDSRVYVIRSSGIERLTTDHSFIEELIKNGSITREDAENHPKKNIITRALGCSEQVQTDIYINSIEDNDTYILCTDGLTNMVPEEEILRVVEEISDPDTICEELVKKANDRGGEDNITVIVFKNEF